MRKFTTQEAKEIGKKIGLNWHDVDIEQFRRGLEVETEHDTKSPKTDVVKKDSDIGKIALAHLLEIPNYYSYLGEMEKKAKAKSKLEKACVALRDLSDRLF